jgi:hypothetical protein
MMHTIEDNEYSEDLDGGGRARAGGLRRVP